MIRLKALLAFVAIGATLFFYIYATSRAKMDAFEFAVVGDGCREVRPNVVKVLDSSDGFYLEFEVSMRDGLAFHPSAKSWIKQTSHIRGNTFAVQLRELSDGHFDVVRSSGCENREAFWFDDTEVRLFWRCEPVNPSTTCLDAVAVEISDQQKAVKYRSERVTLKR